MIIHPVRGTFCPAFVFDRLETTATRPDFQQRREDTTLTAPSNGPDGFPAPAYAETVLAVNFEDAKRFFLEHLLDLHAAHALMLSRQGILPAADASAILAALGRLDRAKIAGAVYDGSVEDLFFYIERELEVLCGAETAGRLHTARSRNDIVVTLYRMRIREDILELSRLLGGAAATLLRLTREHRDTVMPAHTHTQPAQPTTLGHYLLAALETFERSQARLEQAFAGVNRSPMGACAITTTAFPIDREEMARLLGFDGLQENSYGAIAAIDYATATAAAVAVWMVDLGKVTQDLLLWSTSEFGYIRLGAGYVQSSSIMPQKRNPVALEHTRILASRALSEAQAVLTCAHNTPFGDINDSEDDLQPLIALMFEDARRAARLFAGALASASFNREQLRHRAGRRFLTVTELADTLVRSAGLSFRQAHQLVARTVSACGEDDRTETILEALEAAAVAVLGSPLAVKESELRTALDPEHFVRIRKIAGGPAPEPMEAALRTATERQALHEAWIEQRSKQLATCRARLREAVGRSEESP
jgi:argininosuccinate lyase